jgi:YegS C-terminal NAD kinase beta sandwich-like domain
MTVRRGESWGEPPTGPPDVEVEGDDAALAAVADARLGARVAFRPAPGSDLARALGVAGDPARRAAHEVPIDGLRLDHPPAMAVNAVVLGAAPDRLRWWSRAAAVEVTVDGRARFRGRATTVVVASGQYLRGADVVPRGHPGDGRAEVQVYGLSRGERGRMRRRLAQGAHVPHPRIRETAGRRIEVAVAGTGLPLEVDGVRRGRAQAVGIEVVPAVLTLLA